MLAIPSTMTSAAAVADSAMTGVAAKKLLDDDGE